MHNHQITAWKPIEALLRNRQLILSLTKREIAARYRGTMGGMLWAVINPLLMLSVYTFVFSVIFKARWGQEATSNTEYALVVFVGLLVFQVFSECINRAPTLIIGNASYVKKVIFPLEILPYCAMGAALFQCAISLGIWMLAYCLFMGAPHLTALLLPLVILPFLMLTIGVSWFLASLGVYVRDTSQIVGIVTTVLFFMSPIFYPITAVPEKFLTLYHLNPVTYAVEQARDVLFFGRYPDPLSLGLFYLASALVAWLGFAWFQKTRKGFADVL